MVSGPHFAVPLSLCSVLMLMLAAIGFLLEMDARGPLRAFAAGSLLAGRGTAGEDGAVVTPESMWGVAGCEE